MAAVLVGAAIRGSSGVVARAALGQIGAGVRNLAFGVAAAAGVLGAKRRSDSRQEDAILESTHLSDTVEDTLLAEPVTARELCTPLDGTEAANAPLPVVGEAETYAEDTYAEDPGVSATTIWNVARLAVDITRLGVSNAFFLSLSFSFLAAFLLFGSLQNFIRMAISTIYPTAT